MEEQSVQTGEERKAREKFWTEMTKLGLKMQGKLTDDDLADVAPHLVGRG